MAQKINIILVDDIDGSEAAETVSFGLDGTTYEIDLNDVHAKTLKTALEPFIEVARKVSRRSKSGPKQSSVAAAPKEIRAWAVAQGMDIPDRGRIPEEVRKQYVAAH